METETRRQHTPIDTDAGRICQECGTFWYDCPNRLRQQNAELLGALKRVLPALEALDEINQGLGGSEQDEGHQAVDQARAAIAKAE